MCFYSEWERAQIVLLQRSHKHSNPLSTYLCSIIFIDNSYIINLTFNKVLTFLETTWGTPYFSMKLLIRIFYKVIFWVPVPYFYYFYFVASIICYFSSITLSKMLNTISQFHTLLPLPLRSGYINDVKG